MMDKHDERIHTRLKTYNCQLISFGLRFCIRSSCMILKSMWHKNKKRTFKKNSLPTNLIDSMMWRDVKTLYYIFVRKRSTRLYTYIHKN